MASLFKKSKLGMGLIIGIPFLFIFLLPFAGKLISVLTDFLWFREIGYAALFKKTLFTKVLLALCGGGFAWIATYINLLIADKLARKTSYEGLDPALSQLNLLLPFLKYVYPLASLFFAFILGSWASGQWEAFLRFVNRSPFGVADPLLNHDIGFYVFALPFIKFLYSYAIAAIVLCLAGAIAVYTLHQNVGTEEGRLKISTAAKRHVLLGAGIICLMLFGYFQFRIYGLLNEGGSIVNGAGYATTKAYLPFLKILRVLCIVSSILIFAGMKGPKLRFPAIGIGLILGFSLLGSGLTRALQKIVVSPNEIVKETPYIQWSIDNTRSAFNLDKIEEKQFLPSKTLNAELLEKNHLTVENIRLWDHGPLLTTFSQLQEIRTYYEFLDVDNDRYYINGDYRQVMLSPRELVPSSLPSRIWINEHLSYTHGFGLCLGPVNKITPQGLPEFFIKDIPPASNTSVSVKQPEIYYGESASRYVIVNSQAKEFDYPSGDENVYATYKGKGGIKIGGLLKKLLFVLRFKELKILLSSDIIADSRIMYHRHIMERTKKVMPFIRYDSDPYLVIKENGKLTWIIDGYTVTDKYPYSANVSGLGNYIRNSVKVLIDAYDGSITFYVSDPSDPIIKTYANIFPNAFQPIEAMPQDVRNHIRYPQGLFTIQANIYSLYHMTDPQVFYNKEDLWKIPEQFSSGSMKTMVPYYTIMKLAGVGDKEEFILMVPFSPAKKENMIAWLAARCDGPNYGKLLVFNFPKQQLVYGPRQIESRIDQNPEISKQLTLWDQGGSRVIRGSLLVIPIESSLIYVEPLYIAAEDGGVPELKRVIVAYGDRIVMEEDLQKSLAQLFDISANTTRSRRQDVSQDASINARQHAGNLPMQIEEANKAYLRAQEALSRGDWAGYGHNTKRVEALLREMLKNTNK